MRPRARSGATSRGDVGELQRQAEVHGVVASARMPAAEDVEADHPHRRRNPPAVLAQIVEGRIARMVEVHLNAVDEILERAPGQRVASGHRLQRHALPRFGRPAVEYPGDLAAPEPELGGGGGRVRRLVHGVVDGPARVPHRDDGVAFGRRQHEEGVVEGGVAAHSSVLHPTTSASAAPSVGRAATGSKPPCSSSSRIRAPPCQVARSSHFSRPLTWSRAAGPDRTGRACA